MSTHIQKVGVCGAGGTMGAGIAIVASRAGFETACFDTSMEILDRARGQTEGFFGKSVDRGKMAATDRDAALARLSASTDMGALADCDLVIEAVFEDLGVKRELFRALDAVCKPEALFASNTSTLSITEIAAGCDRQDRVVGMHFCLPAQLMKLIEMSPGVNTSDEAFAGALSMEPSPGAATVAPFARTRLKRPAGADASAWAAREAELVAWFEGGGE